MARYMLIRPDEDGNPIRWLDDTQLQELLDDPTGSYGVKAFLGGDEPDAYGDPNYWSRGIGLLVRVEVVTPVPAGSYRLPDADEQAGERRG
jgi:hypothetical protein